MKGRRVSLSQRKVAQLMELPCHRKDGHTNHANNQAWSHLEGRLLEQIFPIWIIIGNQSLLKIETFASCWVGTSTHCHLAFRGLGYHLASFHPIHAVSIMPLIPWYLTAATLWSHVADMFKSIILLQFTSSPSPLILCFAIYHLFLISCH